VAGDVAARSVNTRAAIATTGLGGSTMATRLSDEVLSPPVNLNTDIKLQSPEGSLTRGGIANGLPRPCCDALCAKLGCPGWRRLARERTDSISRMLFLPVAFPLMQQAPCRTGGSHYRD
jgi:hypothetical protein